LEGLCIPSGLEMSQDPEEELGNVAQESDIWVMNLCPDASPFRGLEDLLLQNTSRATENRTTVKTTVRLTISSTSAEVLEEHRRLDHCGFWY